MFWPTAGVAVLCVLVLASGAGQWWLAAADWPPGDASPELPPTLVASLVTLILAAIGALVVLRGDSPRYGWVILGTAVAISVVGFAGLNARHALESGMRVDPASVWVQDLWMATQMLGFLLLPALFPDGRPASSRWRIAVAVTSTAWISLIVLFVLADRPATNLFLGVSNPPPNPTGILPVPMDIFNVGWAILVLASVVTGIGSLVTRWRHADHEFRQRFKWILYAFAMLLTMIGFGLVSTILIEAGVDLGVSTLLEWLTSAAFLGLAVALGFAVLRFRLYDVDLVINRTLVYGVLTGVVVLAYITVVVAIGALVPVEESLLALVTTGVVAVAFAPFKDRVQGWVNRLMYGQRDDPYAVLVEMGRLMTEIATPDETLQTLTETVASSLKLPGVSIELEQNGVWTKRASSGTGADVETGGVAIPLRDQGEVMGRLVVMPRSSRDPLAAKDMDLLDDIAHPAGVIARSVRLTVALQSSRERLVMAREEERRRLRRDLHDGLGPSLASQTFLLDEVLDRLRDDPVAAGEMVASLKEQNQQLVAEIRRLVYELRPPALDELGVAGALRAHVAQFEQSGKLVVQVRTVPDPLPSLPAAIEVAAYRIAREAILNTIRHAAATWCVAAIEAAGTKLTVSVRDDGKGIGSSPQHGIGLIAMKERSEELGGTFAALWSDGHGTDIVATLPLVNDAVELGISDAGDRDPAGAHRG